MKASQGEEAVFYGGEYVTEQNAVQDIALAVAICTYKREKYLYRNLDLLYQRLWENEDSVLYHKLHTIVVDNGRWIGQEKRGRNFCLSK